MGATGRLLLKVGSEKSDRQGMRSLPCLQRPECIQLYRYVVRVRVACSVMHSLQELRRTSFEVLAKNASRCMQHVLAQRTGTAVCTQDAANTAKNACPVGRISRSRLSVVAAQWPPLEGPPRLKTRAPRVHRLDDGAVAELDELELWLRWLKHARLEARVLF